MKTLILPGYSPTNQEWTEQTIKDLSVLEPQAVAWAHWATGDPAPNWVNEEAIKIATQIGSEEINLIAKSMGTLVAMELVKIKSNQIAKLILCGLPLHDLDTKDLKQYEVLNKIPAQIISCFQNEQDHHGSYLEAKEFLSKINRNISIKLMPGNNHEYFYSQEFLKFLNGSVDILHS